MGSCAGIPIECDEHADCGGGICCVFKAGSNTNSVECASGCSGSNEDPLCGNDACVTLTCVDNPALPDPYDNCN